MPRRKRVIKRKDIGADPVYHSETVQRLINKVMNSGKKNVASKIVYDALGLLEKKAGDKEKALELFMKAYNEITPLVEVRSRRVGGSVYQIPREVSEVRARSLTLRWLIESASKRSDKTMGIRLGQELIEASESRGGAVKKKLDMHKMAEANRAFSHFAW